MNNLVPSNSEDIIISIKGTGALPQKWEEPFVKLRDRHTARVVSLSMNDDETLMLSGSEDNAMMLVNITTKDIHTFRGHLHPVCAVAFQANTNHAVSVGLDSSINIWDLNKKTNIYSNKLFSEHEEYQVPACCISRDGEMAAFCMNDVIKIFDIKNKQIIRTIDKFQNISCLRIGNNNRSLIIGRHDSGIYIVDIKGSAERKISTNEGVYSLDASNTIDFLIAAGTYSGQLNIYRNFDQIKSEALHSKCILSVSISANNELVFSGGVEKAVGWSLLSDEKDAFYCNGHVHSLFISSTNKYCIIGINDGSIDAISIKEKRKIYTNVSDEQISTLCFDKTHKKIVFGSNANKIQSWDFKSGELYRFDRHTGGVTCLSLSPDQNIMVSGGKDRNVLIWDYAEGKVNKSFSLNENWITSVFYSTVKNLLCVASLDNTVKIVDAKSNTILNQYTHDNVTSVTTSSESNMVFSGGNRSIKAFNLSNNNERTLVTIDGVVNALIIFDSDDLMISGGSNKQVRVGTIKGDLLKKYSCESSICSVVLASDKNTIIAGGSEGEIYLIDRQLSQISKIPAHSGGKVKVALIGEGEYFMSGGNDGIIKLWNIPSKQVVLTLLVAGDNFIIFANNYYYWSNNPDVFYEFYNNVENKYLDGLDYESYKLQYADKLKIKSILNRIVN